MTHRTEIPDLLHHLFTLGNCDERELALLADFDVPGAETELSSRLASQKILALKAEAELAKEAKSAGMFK